MQLDSYTLLVTSCGLLVALGLAFVFLWLRDRRTTWLLWWGVPIISTGVALISYLPGARAEDFAAVAYGNAARILAIGCLWHGVRLFQGRRPWWGSLSALSLGWIALCLHPPFLESLTARIALASAITAALCGAAAFDLWRDRSDGLRSRLPTLLVFASAAVLMGVRGVVAGVAPYPVGAGEADDIWFAAFTSLTLGHIIFGAIFFLAMTMERREAEQRGFAMSDPLTGLLNRRA
ncbi:MAG TPA: hypothetical protein VFE52_02760, partial [Devosia sp.]|nr:hypothetical protein [Devosia sp.]